MGMIPVPHYACTFWVAGDSLMVAFPGQGPEAKGHTIKLPASKAGLETIITILKDRAQARDLRLSQKGTPSQYEIENDARYKAFKKAIEMNLKEAEELLGGLGT